jgi:hypothetical protein
MYQYELLQVVKYNNSDFRNPIFLTGELDSYEEVFGVLQETIIKQYDFGVSDAIGEGVIQYEIHVLDMATDAIAMVNHIPYEEIMRIKKRLI